MLDLLDAYYSLENSSGTVAKKLDALQSQVDYLYSSSSPKDSVANEKANNDSSHVAFVNSVKASSPTTPAMPVATTVATTTSTTTTTSTSTITTATLRPQETKKAAIPLPYAGERNVTDAPSGATNGSVLSVGPSPTSIANISLVGDGVSTPGRIRKPSHTGGSLPDEDLSGDQSIH